MGKTTFFLRNKIFIKKMIDAKTELELKHLFDVMDENHSGTLDGKEMLAFVESAMLAVGDSKFDRELRKQFDLLTATEVSFEDVKKIFKIVNEKQMDAKNELESIFKEFDVDNSGHLTSNEIEKVVAKLSEKTNSVARQETAKIFQMDQDGSISFSEFQQAFLEAEQTARRKFAYKQLFETHDKNNDSKLSLGETKSLMKSLGFEKLDKENINQFQKEFNAENDEISWELFEKHMEELFLLKKKRNEKIEKSFEKFSSNEDSRLLLEKVVEAIKECEIEIKNEK